MGDKPYTFVQHDPRRHGRRADLDAGAKLRAVFNQRGGMEPVIETSSAPSWSMALNSASAQSVSPTKAWPSNRRPDRGAARLDRHARQIAGAHRLAEARLLDGHEIDDALVPLQAQRIHHQRACRLGQGLDHQNARHHRIAGKMALEMGSLILTAL